MVKFQLALQGGGAKLADLLIALKTVQQYENEGKIEITRIAGTSAGAIAAAIYLTGTNSVQRALDYLQNRVPVAEKEIFKGGLFGIGIGGLCRLLTGRPIFDDTKIRFELTKLFQHLLGLNTAPKFGDLSKLKSLIIMSSNIGTREKVVVSEGNDLVSALFSSCAVPLAFRGAKQLSANPHVDGGICENLPSGELVNEKEKLGEIIAISFSNRVTGQLPESTVSFAYELISTAINNSVQRARSELPRHSVLSVDSAIGLLEFKKAFDLKNREGDIASITGKTESWLEVNREDGKRKIAPYFHRSLGADALATELWHWYMSSQSKLPRRSIRNTLRIVANCLESGTGKLDVIEKSYFFAPRESPLAAMHIAIGSQESQKSKFCDHRILLLSPNREPIRTRILPTIRLPQQNETSMIAKHGYLVLFEDYLPPMTDEEFKRVGPYELSFVSEVPGTLSDIHKKRTDYIRHINERSEPYGSVSIVIHYPSDFKFTSDVKLRLPDGQEGEYSQIGGVDLASYEKLSPVRFSTVGWTAKDFTQGSELRVDLSL